MPTRVFWPSDGLAGFQKNEPCIAVGWKNTEEDYVVTCILPFLPVALARRLLDKDMFFVGTKTAHDLYNRYDGERLQVLAACNHHQQSCYFAVDVMDNGHNDFEIRAASGARDIQVVLYQPPNARWLNYLSFEPIELNIFLTNYFTVVSAEHEKDLVYLKEVHSAMRKHAQEHALDMIETSGKRRCEHREKILRRCLSQINCSQELGILLGKNAKKLFPKAIRLHESQKRLPSGARRLSISAQRLGMEARRKAEASLSRRFQRCAWLFVWILVALRFCCDTLIKMLDIEIWNGCPLHEVSATAQQLDLMVKRIAYYPEQYLVIRKRSRSWPTPDYNVEYIRFYNSIWLGINDRILGYSLATFIYVHRGEIFKFAQYLSQDFFGDRFVGLVRWLMSWPGGLKLHDELSQFAGGIVVWVILAWQELTKQFAFLIWYAIIVLAWAGRVGGMSLQIAVLSDAVSVLTFQTYCFYMASAKIYRNELAVLSSLFRLFRGQKYNVLRNRIDSGDYDLAQLLLGTIVFTVLIFLLPTIMTFYAAFASTRILLVSFSAGLEMALTFLNHFPLFILLLRIKSPGRLPGGVNFELTRCGDETHKRPTVLSLQSEPLAMKWIFHQYKVVAQRFAKHYLSVNVTIGVLTGRHVSIQRTKLYRLLYSMLPARRTSLHEFYHLLRRELVDGCKNTGEQQLATPI